MTTSSTARVSTPRPARYAKQLASHMSRRLDTRWDGDEGRGHISFTGDAAGELEMIAGDGVLLLQLEGPQDQIAQLEEVVGRHLVRFGGRNELVVQWKRHGGVEGTVWRHDDDVD